MNGLAPHTGEIFEAIRNYLKYFNADFPGRG